MNYHHAASRNGLAGVAAVVMAPVTSSAAHAKHPGYVDDRTDSVIRSGFGECAQVRFVNVTGEADRIGTAQYNEDLSKQRAAAVTDYLQSHSELRPAKFQVICFGESQPVVNCEGNASNTDLIDIH